MATEYIIIVLLAIHWFADFVMQTDKMAQGKSKNSLDLLNHTLTYSGFFVVALFPLCLALYGVHADVMEKVFLFALITLAIHTVQDYITSRINSKLWNDKKVHLFFVSIGFDQLLHFVQLILTYKLLF
jgi:hypothetical protein